MKISVNHKEEELSESISVHVLMEYFGRDPKISVVSLNGEVVTKSMYEAVFVDEGDNIEIITFVGGG